MDEVPENTTPSSDNNIYLVFFVVIIVFGLFVFLGVYFLVGMKQKPITIKTQGDNTALQKTNVETFPRELNNLLPPSPTPSSSLNLGEGLDVFETPTPSPTPNVTEDLNMDFKLPRELQPYNTPDASL